VERKISALLLGFVLLAELKKEKDQRENYD